MLILNRVSLLMRIRIWVLVFTCMRTGSGFSLDADPDPTSQNDADPCGSGSATLAVPNTTKKIEKKSYKSGKMMSSTYLAAQMCGGSSSLTFPLGNPQLDLVQNPCGIRYQSSGNEHARKLCMFSYVDC